MISHLSKMAAALSSVMLSGCLVSPVPLATPTPTPRDQRTVVVYHGLGQTAATFTTAGPYTALLDGLKAQGWNVIVPAYTTEAVGDAMAVNIHTFVDADPTGRTIRDTWVSEYDQLNLTGRVFLLGISWGGLVASNIAAHAEHHPDGIVLHLPALTPTYLTEFNGCDLSALTDFASISVARSYISWALDDTRVGYTGAADLARSLGSTSREYVTLGHTTNTAVVADLLAYIATVGAS